MIPSNLYYFAFGSNMLQSRLNNRLSYPAFCIGTQRLNGYQLVFNCGSSNRSFANIQRFEFGFVEGVLYELSDDDIHRLDMYEGYPHNYQKKFFKLDDGNVAFAYVSVKPEYFSSALPESEYLDLLIDGAYEHGLLSTYKMLLSFKEENNIQPKPKKIFFGGKKSKKQKKVWQP